MDEYTGVVVFYCSDSCRRNTTPVDGSRPVWRWCDPSVVQVRRALASKARHLQLRLVVKADAKAARTRRGIESDSGWRCSATGGGDSAC